MATKTFGTHKAGGQNQPRDYLAEMQKIAPGCLISVTVNPAGELVGASYETSWREGGTVPVEKTDKKTKEVFTEYQENFKDKKLTSSQSKALDKYIEDNLAV